MLVRGTLRVAWWGFAVAIVTLAVALSAARLLLPGMAEYKTQIEVAAQDFFNRPVQIGSLDAAWQGLSPVLKLEQVVIQDPQFPDGELTIDEIQVALDVVNSFMTRQWLTAGIKLIGIRLSLATDLANREKTSQGLGPLAWLLRQESFTVEDLQLSWSDPGLFKTPVELTELSLQVVN